MVKKKHTLLVDKRSLQPQLQRKSRRRRENLRELAKASAAPRARRNDTLPRLELVSIGLDDLRLPARKIRKRDPAHVQEVAGSISELGFCDPILVGSENLVLDGEIRVEATKLLHLAAVPCIRIDHLTDVEQCALGLTLNRLCEKGEWDLAELKIEFEELILTDAPIEISGFSLEQIDQVVLGDEPAAGAHLLPSLTRSPSRILAIYFASVSIALFAEMPPIRRLSPN